MSSLVCKRGVPFADLNRLVHRVNSATQCSRNLHSKCSISIAPSRTLAFAPVLPVQRIFVTRKAMASTSVGHVAEEKPLLYEQIDWKHVKDQFPSAKKHVYLNAGQHRLLLFCASACLVLFVRQRKLRACACVTFPAAFSGFSSSHDPSNDCSSPLACCPPPSIHIEARSCRLLVLSSAWRVCLGRQST